MIDNHLLERLPDFVAVNVRPRLKPLDFIQGDVVARAQAPIDRLIFPRSGLVSIVVELDGSHQIETGIVGRRGALGGAAIFGVEHHLNAAVAQASGRAWTLDIAEATELASTSPEFHRAILLQEQYLLAQARQFAACNAKHLVEQRLCSWLARLHDEVGDGELPLTQETLAKMLGVQRASVSLLASQLQEDGLISYRRGRINLLDPEGLQHRACSCYRALEDQRDDLFASKSHNKIAVDKRSADGATEGPPPN